MRNIISIVLVICIFMAFPAFTAYAKYNDEITFREIPFGTPYQKVIEQCENFNWKYSTPPESFRQTFNIKVSNVSLAGHSFNLILSFICDPKDGKINHVPEEAVLSKAEYVYETTNVPNVYVPEKASGIADDLNSKLCALYGDSEVKDKYTYNHNRITPVRYYDYNRIAYSNHGKNSTEVSLQVSFCSYSFYKITVTYEKDYSEWVEKYNTLLKKTENDKILKGNLDGL